MVSGAIQKANLYGILGHRMEKRLSLSSREKAGKT